LREFVRIHSITVLKNMLQSYGALFPFGQYTLLNSLLTSIGCYVGIAIICIILIFPESVNHKTLVLSSGLVGQLKSLVDLQQKVLSATPDDLADGAPLASQMQGMRVALLGQMQAREF
jgi:hypothetical protein